MSAAELFAGFCDGCGQHREIAVGIILLEAGDQEPEDLAFCSPPCMADYVARRRWAPEAMEVTDQHGDKLAVSLDRGGRR